MFPTRLSSISAPSSRQSLLDSLDSIIRKARLSNILKTYSLSQNLSIWRVQSGKTVRPIHLVAQRRRPRITQVKPTEVKPKIKRYTQIRTEHVQPEIKQLTSEDSPADGHSGQLRGVTDSKFLTRFLETHKLPYDSLDYFKSIDWTRKIVEAKTHQLMPFYSRYLNESNGESRFFAETINTPEGVPHVLGFCRKDLWPSNVTGSEENGSELSGIETNTAAAQIDNALPEFMCLIHLGKTLEAHPSIVNGGFQSVIFDEVMYCTILLHAHRDELRAERPKHYTLDLTTKFLKPVNIQNNYLVRANVVSRQDRKWTVEGEIIDKDGVVLTRGESHWLTAKTALS